MLWHQCAPSVRVKVDIYPSMRASSASLGLKQNTRKREVKKLTPTCTADACLGLSLTKSARPVSHTNTPLVEMRSLQDQREKKESNNRKEQCAAHSFTANTTASTSQQPQETPLWWVVESSIMTIFLCFYEIKLSAPAGKFHTKPIIGHNHHRYYVWICFNLWVHSLKCIFNLFNILIWLKTSAGGNYYQYVCVNRFHNRDSTFFSSSKPLKF